MKATGEDYIDHPETIEEWHILMRKNEDRFAHSNPFIAAGKKLDPLFSTENPRAKISFLKFAYDLAVWNTITDPN